MKIQYFILILFTLLSSCKTYDDKFNEKKELLNKIIKNPFAIDSIIKNSNFYDSTFFLSKEIKYMRIKNFEIPDKNLLQEIEILSRSEYDLTVDYNFEQIIYTKEPNLLNGETFKDAEFIFIKHNILGVTFKKEKIGIGVDFIFYRGKYYFLNVFLVTPNEDYKYLNKFGL